MQKKVIFISGTIGSGKTTLSEKLVYSIPNSVMLDGDWCFHQGNTWYFDKETKDMAINNIITVLNSYINNPNFENIIFCWTLHKQDMIDKILNSLVGDFKFYHFSLICSEKTIQERIRKRSIERTCSLGIPYSEEKVQKDILGALKKTEFYFENDAIKLNGDDTLENLYNEITNNINLSKGTSVKS